MRIESSGKPDAWKLARPVWGWGRGAIPRPTPLRTLLVVVTLASVLCSIGVCLGWGIALAIAVLAIFYGGGRVDRRRLSVVLALGPRWLSVLLKAIMLLLAACGGMTVLLLTGFALTPTGDPYSLLLRTMAFSIPACICYTFGRRMASCQWPFNENRLWFFGLIPLAAAVVGLCVYQDQMLRRLAWIVLGLAIAGILMSFQPWCNAVGLPSW